MGDAMKLVYDFAEGDKSMKFLLGGKGANIAEMTRLGLPVPPGFTITTDACKAFLESGDFPPGLLDDVAAHRRSLEERMGRRLGDAVDPLLVSVRSGAAFSMPGMMDTVLNLGLNDVSVEGIAAQTGDRRFALDSYRRFIQMFGRIVRGVEGESFEEVLFDAKKDAGVTADSDLSEERLADVVERFKGIYRDHTGEEFPSDPDEQLRQAISAVFSSWNGRRARDYRRLNKIPDDLGTAVNVQAMVFGNKGGDSGTGVAFTRDPNIGARHPVVDFLSNAQGEDVVAGIRTTEDLEGFRGHLPQQCEALLGILELLEGHYRDMCDVEFTIEQGTLYVLQTRVAKRTGAAALRIAVDMVAEGAVSENEAVMRVTPEQLDQLLHPRFDPAAEYNVLARGVAASPGAATGAAVFDADVAAERGDAGEAVILVREATSPDDLHGMAASQGILTAQGGNLSHAAIVAKGMGIPAVCGASELSIDEGAGSFSVDGTVVSEGDVISIDGSAGVVVVGEVPVVVPEPDESFRTLLSWADSVRRLGVRANADLPDDCRKAREFGAEGVGLCRTEHMFLGERLPALQRFILAGDAAEAEAALGEIFDRQHADFVAILEAMDGLPVTIRLLDPPLHEFLPNLETLIVAQATGRASHKDLAVLEAVRSLAEENPMLGTRGCRLGIERPELYRSQVRAIARAALERTAAGGDPRVEIMIPLVSHVSELARLRAETEAEWADVTGGDVPVKIGTMIEVPRAALTAGPIAGHADFFSFGTNDLTQMTWGFSRDDAEGTFLSRYLEEGVLNANPFETLDREGVGRLVELATKEGRSTRADLKIGICGEHGGDPASIAFCDETGLDYVSASPYRVPVARLAAAQAVLGGGGDASR